MPWFVGTGRSYINPVKWILLMSSSSWSSSLSSSSPPSLSHEGQSCSQSKCIELWGESGGSMQQLQIGRGFCRTTKLSVDAPMGAQYWRLDYYFYFLSLYLCVCKNEIPSEMKETPRHKLLTLLTLFTLSTLFTVSTLFTLLSPSTLFTLLSLFILFKLLYTVLQ